MTHPDLCPYCRAPISPTQRQRIDAEPPLNTSEWDALDYLARRIGYRSAQDLIGEPTPEEAA